MELQKHDHPDVQAIVADLVDIASDIQNMGIGDDGDEMMSPMDGFPGDDLEGGRGRRPACRRRGVGQEAGHAALGQGNRALPVTKVDCLGFF